MLAALANELGLAIPLEDVRDELSFGMLGRRDIGQDLNPGEAFSVESRTITSILNNSATK